MLWISKEKRNRENRRRESRKLRSLYPDHIPIILKKVSGSNIMDIDRRKYLVPSDVTAAQFISTMKNRLQLPPGKDIYLFTDKTPLKTSLTLEQVYERERGDDGFLYMEYSAERKYPNTYTVMVEDNGGFMGGDICIA
ncbi:hypothetical protein GDO81_028476 [Engystomops pustulosus]|uniref:Uncharacterized protein n=1 Tax=Engystomops pustulosus TaxID=76066 RepID=A0AAV6YD60_ENGPU|nr:hypothetical protein GDO81_028476 [Engystomops pustulosus]